MNSLDARDTVINYRMRFFNHGITARKLIGVPECDQSNIFGEHFGFHHTWAKVEPDSSGSQALLAIRLLAASVGLFRFNDCSVLTGDVVRKSEPGQTLRAARYEYRGKVAKAQLEGDC